MKKFLFVILLGICGTLLADTQETFTILSINDVYEVEAKDGLGGMAELSTMIQEEKATAKNAIVTVNGDFLSPSLLGMHYKGKHMIDMFNRIGVDLVVFGNHEFDFGAETLKKCMDVSNFTWLGTNVFDRQGKRFHGAKNYWVHKVGDLKVGFFGVCTPQTKELSRGGDEVDFRPVKESSEEAILKLKQEGADVIVGITHLTIAEDQMLAKSVPGIDLILGGHEHIPFTKRVGKTLIHKSGSDAHYLVRMDLHILKKSNADGEEYVTVIPEWKMRANFQNKKDEQLANVIASYQSELDRDLSANLCSLQTVLCSKSHCLRSRETAIGNMVADAIKNSLEVQAAIINAGTIRGERDYKAGHILNRKDIIQELPFSNGCKALYISGATLLDALQFGVSCAPELKGGFPQISGMKLEYNPNLPLGSQIVKVWIDGAPIQMDKEYLVAVTDYMAGGGDGYQMLSKLEADPNISTEKVLYSLVSEYLEKEGNISPIIEGRIKITSKESTSMF